MHFMHLYVSNGAKLREDVLFSEFQLASDCRNAIIGEHISEEIQSVLTAQLAFMALSIRK